MSDVRRLERQLDNIIEVVREHFKIWERKGEV